MNAFARLEDSTSSCLATLGSGNGISSGMDTLGIVEWSAGTEFMQSRTHGLRGANMWMLTTGALGDLQRPANGNTLMVAHPKIGSIVELHPRPNDQGELRLRGLA